MATINPVALAKILNEMCRQGRIDPHTYRVGTTLLWSCRGPQGAYAQVSYERLAELAGVGLTKTKQAVKRLRELGWLTWRKTRIKVAWCAGIASRQWRNVYSWLAPGTEVAARPTDSQQKEKKLKKVLRGKVQALNKVMPATEETETPARRLMALVRGEWYGAPVPPPRSPAEQIAAILGEKQAAAGVKTAVPPPRTPTEQIDALGAAATTTDLLRARRQAFATGRAAIETAPLAKPRDLLAERRAALQDQAQRDRAKLHIGRPGGLELAGK